VLRWAEHLHLSAGTCDVCQNGGGGQSNESDVTTSAIKVIATVRELNGRNVQQDVQNADRIIKVSFQSAFFVDC
jgi:hypothetical protein